MSGAAEGEGHQADGVQTDCAIFALHRAPIVKPGSSAFNNSPAIMPH